MSGQLYIVATPIGNLDDMTFRAVDVLGQVAVVAAEDTRHSGALLRHFELNTPLVSLHDHNEANQCQQLVARLRDGQSVALISDAGTPLISDPGYRLVAAAQAADIRVTPVPGACALIAALSASGLPTDRFYFDGFLPAKSAARKQRIEALATRQETVIYYESCHRMLACLVDMQTVLGQTRRVCVAKELTKCFEQVRIDYLPALISWLSSDDKLQQGEFVVLVEGAGDTGDGMAQAEKVLIKLMPHMPLKAAVSLASELCSVSKNQLYQRGLQLKHAP